MHGKPYVYRHDKEIAVRPDRRRAIVSRLAAFDRLVEVGIGTEVDVAAALSNRGRAVTATDIVDRSVPDGVGFAVDDIRSPRIPVYRGADCIYGLNLPPELHGPTATVARQVDATLCFTTLGTDPPTVAATPRMIGDETMYTLQR